VFPSGYFGLYERAYGMVSIPTLFESVLLAPKLVRELLERSRTTRWRWPSGS